MAIKSMTGFARDEGKVGRFSWYWEIRTVNGRGLDIKIRLPQGYDSFEPDFRKQIASHLARGNCNASLRIDSLTGNQEIRLNEAALKQVARAIRRAEMFIEAGEPSMDGILALRGVLEISEPDHSGEEMEELKQALAKSLAKALQSLLAARSDEGRHLQKAVLANIDGIERLVEQIEASPARNPENIRARLRENIARLLENENGLSEERLHQEAVIIAARADIEEEIIRLKAHIASARDLLKSNQAVGRKLDFLTQEFNREANTICSKSNAIDITNAGLEMKALISQVKEQVQNIE